MPMAMRSKAPCALFAYVSAYAQEIDANTRGRAIQAPEL